MTRASRLWIGGATLQSAHLAGTFVQCDLLGCPDARSRGGRLDSYPIHLPLPRAFGPNIAAVSIEPA